MVIGFLRWQRHPDCRVSYSPAKALPSVSSTLLGFLLGTGSKVRTTRNSCFRGCCRLIAATSRQRERAAAVASPDASKPAGQEAGGQLPAIGSHQQLQ